MGCQESRLSQMAREEALKSPTLLRRPKGAVKAKAPLFERGAADAAETTGQGETAMAKDSHDSRVLGQWFYRYNDKENSYTIRQDHGKMLFQEREGDQRLAGELIANGEWQVVNVALPNGRVQGTMRLKYENGCVISSFKAPGKTWGEDIRATKKSAADGHGAAVAPKMVDPAITMLEDPADASDIIEEKISEIQRVPTTKAPMPLQEVPFFV